MEDRLFDLFTDRQILSNLRGEVDLHLIEPGIAVVLFSGALKKYGAGELEARRWAQQIFEPDTLTDDSLDHESLQKPA